MAGRGFNLFGLGKGKLVGCCEHGNELLGFKRHLKLHE